MVAQIDAALRSPDDIQASVLCIILHGHKNVSQLVRIFPQSTKIKIHTISTLNIIHGFLSSWGLPQNREHSETAKVQTHSFHNITSDMIVVLFFRGFGCSL